MSEPVPVLNRTQDEIWKEPKVEAQYGAESPTELPSPLSPAQDESLSEPVNAADDGSLDLLRIVKHKPSAIVFSDYDCSADDQVIVATGSSDDGESPSPGAGGRREEDNYFPESLQYKEFLVSRRRRNLSRNRKSTRKRQDAQPKNTTSEWRKPTREGKPEFTGGREGEDTVQHAGRQVRGTRWQKSLPHTHTQAFCTADT